MSDENKKRLIIWAISLFLCMIFIDEASVAITLPNIRRDFNLSLVSTQWIMNAMFLPLAVLVLFAGKLSDQIGHRKAFTIGVIVFLIASLICTLSINGTMLIVGRALQGISASMMLATYAVLLSQLFPVTQRGLALGSCASYASIFLAVGPLLGGFFSHYLNWRWVFALNLPLAPLILWLIYSCIEKDKIVANRSLPYDFGGLICFLTGFSALVFSLMQAVIFGWDSLIIKILLGTSIALLTLFGLIELRVKSPLADLRLFKNSTFLSGNIILLCTQVIVMCLTYWAIWLQESLKMNALAAGVGLLPAGLPILITGIVGGKWLDQYGPRRPILSGSVIVLIGMLTLTFTATQYNYWWAFVGFLCYGIGAPLIISPAIASVLNSVPDEKKGMAAGMLNTMRQLGAALCFATIGAVITNSVTSNMAQTGMPFYQVYSQAFSYGMLLASFFALVTFLFAFFGLKRSCSSLDQ